MSRLSIGLLENKKRFHWVNSWCLVGSGAGGGVRRLTAVCCMGAFFFETIIFLRKLTLCFICLVVNMIIILFFSVYVSSACKNLLTLSPCFGVFIKGVNNFDSNRLVPSESRQWCKSEKKKNRGFVRKKKLDLQTLSKMAHLKPRRLSLASLLRVWERGRSLSNMAPSVSLLIKKTCVSCRVVWLYLKEVCAKIIMTYPESCSRFLSRSLPE